MPFISGNVSFISLANVLAVYMFVVKKHSFMKTYRAGNQPVMQNRPVNVSAAVAVQSPCLSSVSSENS